MDTIEIEKKLQLIAELLEYQYDELKRQAHSLSRIADAIEDLKT